MFRKLTRCFVLPALAALAVAGPAALPAAANEGGAETSAHRRHRFSVLYRLPSGGDWYNGGNYHTLSAAEDRAADLADQGYVTRVHRHR